MLLTAERPSISGRRGGSLALFTALTFVVSVTACDDPFGVRATTEVKTDTLSVYAMTGTPIGFPAALNTVFRTPVRIDPSFNFHIAFDLDDAGHVRLIPVRLVGGTATASRSVGLQKATGTFDELTIAPTRGYTYDSVLVVSPGEPVFVQSVTPDLCALFINQNLYSKIVVDSILSSARAIHLRMVHDPNCGFRSLSPGIPKV